MAGFRTVKEKGRAMSGKPVFTVFFLVLLALAPAVSAQTPPVSQGPQATRLSVAERDSLLKEHPDWSYTEQPETLRRTIYFQDFSRAFSFMTLIGLEAQRLDHHPDWSNSWNRVEISLTTTDIGGLSHRDAELARIVDEAARSLGGRNTPPGKP